MVGCVVILGPTGAVVTVTVLVVVPVAPSSSVTVNVIS